MMEVYDLMVSNVDFATVVFLSNCSGHSNRVPN